MQVEKTAEGGNFLKSKFVKENKVTELKITDARTIQEVTFEGKDGKPDTTKLQCEVSYKGQTDDSPKQWTMNNKSKNALIDAFGGDTDQWINKAIPITLGSVGTEMEHILVDTMRIE